MKQRRRKKSKIGKVFKILVLLILITGICYGGFFAYKVYKNGGGIQGFLAAAVGHDENTLKNLDKINFLLVGVSGSEENYKLADSIMVCSYDPKEQNATILSIPRDTYVGTNKKKAQAKDKINSVYRNGQNMDGMMKKIEGVTGLKISNYIIIDTESLVQMVDAIGGVEFDVPINMDYDDDTQDLHIHLKAGYQKLSGKQAEWLVRFRHNNNGTTYSDEYGDNDLGRMRTQKEFLAAVAKQFFKPENLVHLNKVAKIGFEKVKTNMNWNMIKDYIPYAVNFNTENLKTGVLPGEPELCNKVWIYTVNKEETKQVVQDLFYSKTSQESGENTVN